MINNLFICTPVISVADNRRLTVRMLNWNPDLLVTHVLADDDNLTLSARDPRRFTAWQDDTAAGPNLTSFSSLIAQPLRRDSTDSGQEVTVYDAEGRPVWSRDPAGTVICLTYDETNRLLSSSQQQSGSAESTTSAIFIYGDNDAETANAQDSNLCGICVRQYDEGGLLTIDSVALSGATLSSTQTFLLSAEEPPDWPEDETGRAALLETASFNTVVEADALGRTCQFISASGHALSSTFDISGVPATRSLILSGQSAVPLLTNMTLNAAGQLLSEIAGNGVTTTCTYDDATLRLTGITALRKSDNVTLQALGYAYDPVGNVTAISDATVLTAWFRNQTTTGTRTFTYDALYQLITASGRENSTHGAQNSYLPAPDDQYLPYNRTYAYDDSGNLTLLTHSGVVNSTMTMVIDTMSNRSVRQNSSKSLTPADVSSWFTAAGQLRTLQIGSPDNDDSDGLLWDLNSQLQSVMLFSRNNNISESNREVYQYRDGLRLRKQTRTLTSTDSGLWTVNEVRYLPGLELRNTWQETVTDGHASAPVYSEQLEVVTTQAGRCEIRALHWVTGLPSGISNDQIRYGVDDNIGSIQLELDGSGQLISREEFYPFGGTAVWTTECDTEVDYKTRRYSGKERDGTGLYYYGQRYYVPWQCRWTAADPFGEINGLNLFRMVGNNPITFEDNTGDNRTINDNFQLAQGDLIYGLSDARGVYIGRVFPGFDLANKSHPPLVIDVYNNAVSKSITDSILDNKKQGFDFLAKFQKDPSKFAKKIKIPKDIRRLAAAGRSGEYNFLWEQYFKAGDENKKFNVQEIYADIARNPGKGDYYKWYTNAGASPGGIAPELLWKRGSKLGIEIIAQSKTAQLHFVLDNIDMAAVVNKTGGLREGKSITASELRYAWRNRERLGDRIHFYKNDSEVPAPWVSDPVLWQHYSPHARASAATSAATGFQRFTQARRTLTGTLRRQFLAAKNS